LPVLSKTEPLVTGRWLLNLFVRGMLAAPGAELFQLQPIGCRFAVLRFRIIPLFAITALQRNDLSGHCSLPRFRPYLKELGRFCSLNHSPSQPSSRQEPLRLMTDG
jgi:hypothetical protein